MNKMIAAVFVVLCSLFFVTTPVFADSVSVNFENPPYTLGVINAQDGWTSLGAAGSGCALYDHAVNSSAGISGFGSQSFRISDAITSGCFGDQTFAKPLNDSVGEASATAGIFSAGTKQAHFETQFDIASAVPASQQPGLHISVSPDRGDGSRMSYLRFEDGATGIDVFFDDVQWANPDEFIETQIASGLNRALKHTVKLTFDAVDGAGNDVVKVWIDGSPVHTGTSWEDYYRFDPEASAEQSPRIVKTLLFRSSGTANLPNAGKGFLVDNVTLSSGPVPPVLVGPPTKESQCKKDGWKQFNNPVFKNQGACEKFVEKSEKDKKDKHDRDDRDHKEHKDRRDDDLKHHKDHHVAKATGDITMTLPSQKLKFSAFDYGTDSSKDKGFVEYWNYEYAGGLHYTAPVLCAAVNTSAHESRFMFQIPSGWPGLTGLYIVSLVKDLGTPGINGDLYGHAATADLTTAKGWCETGVGFAPAMYSITGGNLVVHN